MKASDVRAGQLVLVKGASACSGGVYAVEAVREEDGDVIFVEYNKYKYTSFPVPSHFAPAGLGLYSDWWEKYITRIA